jgi:hypothetical protein
VNPVDRLPQLQSRRLAATLGLTVCVLLILVGVYKWRTPKPPAESIGQANQEGSDAMNAPPEPKVQPLPAAYSIADRLEPYPVLRRVLGEPWIANEEAIHPATSRSALARWLRIDGYEVRPAMLEQLLGRFEVRSGMGARRNSIKSDPLSLAATMTELHFAAWLETHGLRFELTKVGPDFKVQLTEASWLDIEVTTPRQDVWFADIFDRLMVIKRESGFSVRLRFSREDIPDNGRGIDELDAQAAERVVLDIVDEALTRIASSEGLSTAESPSFEQRWPIIGLRATWWNDGSHYMSGAKGPTSPNGWEIWQRVRNAAVEKTKKQLPPDRPSCVLIGADQLNDGDRSHWADWVQRQPDEYVPIRWTIIPSQVKYVIVYKMSWSDLEPTCALLLVNEESAFPHVEGFEEFQRKLFPIHFRPTPTRFTVWASTARCTDRRWF